jgi:arylsulfatase A-like enzyme
MPQEIEPYYSSRVTARRDSTPRYSLPWMQLWLACAFPMTLIAIVGCKQPPTHVSPNMLLIVVDTLRADSLSYAGYLQPTSPNLDAFGKTGTVFRNAFTVGSNTTTSMAALMTGRFPFYLDKDPGCSSDDCAVPWNESTWFGMQRFRSQPGIGLPDEIATLAEILQSGGYTTAGVVTNPYLKERYHFDRGFDNYQERITKSCPMVNEAAEAWMRNDQQQPFFLFLHYLDPHAPYLPPARFREVLEFERSPFADTALFAGAVIAKEALKHRSNSLEAHVRGLYDAEVRHVDECIGQVIDILKRQPYYDDMVIVFLSDHGEEFFEHGQTGHLGRFYDEHIRVPLIVRAPEGKSGEIDTLVRNFDVMPTLLDYAGIPLPDGMDAVSLRPLVERRVTSLDLAVFANFPFPATRRMYRTGRYKLMVDTSSAEATEFYDLLQDPAETRNLYSDPSKHRREELAQLLGALVGKLENEETRTKGVNKDLLGIDPETAGQLRSLGYLD